METKVCSKCKLEYAISFYQKQKNAPDGLRYECNLCKCKYYPGFKIPNKNNLKRCPKCNSLKSKLDFYIKKTRQAERIAGHCKSCEANLAQNWAKTKNGKDSIKRQNKKNAKYKAEWSVANWRKRKKTLKQYTDNSIKNLTDWYVKSKIYQSCGATVKQMTPEIIEAKRNQLLLHRKLKEVTETLAQKES